MGLLLFFVFLFSCGHKTIDYDADAKFYKNLDDSIYKRYNIEKPKETIAYLDSVFATIKQVSNYGRYYLYNRKRTYYSSIDDIKNGDLYADSALSVLEQNSLQAHYPEQYAYALLSKGSTAFALHNYNSSYDYYYRAITFAKQNLDVCKLKDYSYAVAMTLYSQQKYRQSANYFKQAFTEYLICKDNKRDAWHMQEILNNTALCYTKVDQSDSALFYYNKALFFIKKNLVGLVTDKDIAVANAVIYGNMGKVYYKKNQLDTAESLLIKSINTNLQPYGDHKDAQLEQVQLANLYLKRNQLESLHKTLSDLESEFAHDPSERAKLDWLMLMSQYYDLTHHEGSAFKYYRTYIQMRDSVNEVNKKAFQTDILQQLREKEQQLKIDTLTKDNQLSHIYLWLSVAIAILALTIIALVYHYYIRGKQNIQALTRLNKEVGEQKDKLEFAMVELEKSNNDKDRILKVVAHDLRNPIGGIAMLTNALMEENSQNEEGEQILSMIEKSAQNSLKLIHELLETDLHPDDTAIHKQYININETIRQCVHLMRVNADKKNQELELSLLPNPLSINMNKGQIERVISNLLSNAIKFSPIGGKISISLQQKNASVLIAVKDRGMGIPADLHHQIFNTFTDATRKGTAGEKSFGLGLSICKQIIEAHKGKIWVESEIGEGATFYVELPI
ncbi:MAG TPA: HAMP domain-containing sensor histidine kinase [Mucilaginibacter sp.]